jgi:hypothetical protein
MINQTPVVATVLSAAADDAAASAAAQPPAPLVIVPEVQISRQEHERLLGEARANAARLSAAVQALEADVRTKDVEIRTLRNVSDVANAKTAENEGLVRQLIDLTTSLQQLEQRFHESEQLRLQAEQDRQQAELQAYANGRVAQEQAAGNGLIVELVRGNTAAEIDASIEAAKQAYARYAAPAPAQLPAARRAVTVTAVAPSAFPATPSPAPVVESQGTGGFVDAVHAATTPEAIRDGRYAQQRTQLLAQIRGQSYAGPLSNQPRYVAQPYAQPSVVTQPLALPGPGPGISPQAMQTQHVQPGQVQQVPQNDIAAMRAKAVEAAQRHLANPAQASQGGSADAAATSAYLAQHGYGGVPNPNAQFTGQNPMIRNG